ncbi:hypothetical protein [Streptomyces sp. NPDC090112]|uniref:hypothetical protein n=1 Tax=Streptomyces sp. NPDC090112 TaxID=3365949 RepID=UPI00380E5193
MQPKLSTSWVSGDIPLTEIQGWKLVGLQHAGSAHTEMFMWDAVRAWERKPATVLAEEDRTPESRERIAHARATAVTAMRDMLLRGCPGGVSMGFVRESSCVWPG